LTIRLGNIVLPPNGSVGLALVRFVLMVIIGAVAAEGLHWLYEKPLIGIGRRLAKRVQQRDLHRVDRARVPGDVVNSGA
jgi:peptidoglycan/LPS O-acetylase OafA/YrhL